MISSQHQAAPLAAQLDTNISRLQDQLGYSCDLVYRYLDIMLAQETARIALVYIEGLVDSEIVHENLISPLLSEQETRPASELYLSLADLIDQSVSIGPMSRVNMDQELITGILNGKTAILLDGSDEALLAGTSGWDKRSIEEPQTQTVVRGPKEGFTEDIRTNLSLLRRKIKSPDLRFESFILGRYTQTEVIVSYVIGLANQNVLTEVKQRLNNIDTDSILESGYIEELIENTAYTPFPTLMNTERPDAAAAGLLEGQIIIIIDGTPFVLLAPVTFFKFLQSSEDYYQRYDIASFVRLIRYASFLISMLLPSLYIAITTFHQEMLPTTLLVSLAAQREGVPFPALVEAFLMEITFEVLREAGIRMPRVVGPAISIVGALVLGQAAVQAGLVSAAMVIVVSFTAISNFVTPAINLAVAARLIRFGLMVLAGTLGLFGILVGCMAILIHMASLRSFGIPYLAPLAPYIKQSMKDIFVRLPRWMLQTRPVLLTKNVRRQRSSTKPDSSKD
ncbi:spore germination protein [Paenibacillus hexagrammi]|uniref:Spore germination protein n=1 Tax=Paenibacillus hexagrammi TaxID=2908839 RepID=A0ABY3SLU4_9BACL|nr:spore germination protein [Paenibacillus sp. YPD9-1]UJF34380.1 spore germination protein [Paenibacillus sp. YPD9-1]